MTNRLDTLKQKRDQLNAQILKMQASRKSKERKEDTRRKILIGAYFFDAAKRANNLPELYKKMQEYVTRDNDKKLFE